MKIRKGEGRTRIALRLLRRRLGKIGPAFLIVFAFTATALFLIERNEPGTRFDSIGDTIWFCVVTMSTVGYGDVYPITPAGRAITGGFILFTLTTLGLLVTAISEAVMEVKRMEEAGLIGTQMENHVVVCGFNSMARAALVELMAADRKVALLCESHDELGAARDYQRGDAELFITSGEPSQELFRDRLNAERAEAVIIAMHDDAKNLIATLNMKAVNPRARLVVALQREELRQTLMAGGVTYIASPNELSGRLVASAAFEPEVAQLLEDLMSGVIGSYDMQQYQAGKLGGHTVQKVRSLLHEIDGPLLVAVAKKEASGYRIVPHPPPDLVVEAIDQIVVLADNPQAERLTAKYGVQQGR
jgi:voltage-gated potassium channel